MNEFKTCNKCSGFDSEQLVLKLKELDNTAKIQVACQSMCAVGVKRTFVIVNGIPVTGDTVDEVIDKVRNMLDV